jgi:hypothetical protein
MIAAASAAWLGACARPVVYQAYSTTTRKQAVALIVPSDGNDIGQIDGRSIPEEAALGTAVVEVLPGEHDFMVRMRRTLSKQGSYFSISGRGRVEANRCYRPQVQCPNVWKDCGSALTPADCPSIWFARRREVRAWRFDSDSWPECHRERGPPPFPEEPECVASNDPEDDGPPSCVPVQSRGPLIAHDRALGVRVYRACERPVEHGQRGPVRVDRRRLIVERTGERAMIYNDFDNLVRDDRSLPIPDGDIRRFTQSQCPETAGPDSPGERCIFVDLATNTIDLPALMRAFAQLYAEVPAVCIPVVVELGVPAPCPEHLMLGH